MLADAFASIAGQISAAFDGPYHDAIARWPGEPVYDDGGSIIAPGVPVEKPCQVQVDSATEAMRAEIGYVGTDVRLLVLTATLAGVLDTAATVEVLGGPGAGRYSVQSAARDPLGVCWDCRGRRV